MTNRAGWGKIKKKKAEDNNCPPSAALWFLKCVFTCLRRRAAQRASLAWCQTPSLLTGPNNHPAICTCSNYYPISNKYRTITARNPHTQAAVGCKNPGREKLAGSSNSSDQTAINQQRHVSQCGEYRRKLNTFSSNGEGWWTEGKVGGYRCGTGERRISLSGFRCTISVVQLSLKIFQSMFDGWQRQDVSEKGYEMTSWDSEFH